MYQRVAKVLIRQVVQKFQVQGAIRHPVDMLIISYARIRSTQVGAGEATQQLEHFQRSVKGVRPFLSPESPDEYF